MSYQEQEDYREGCGCIAWTMATIALAIALALYGCGCATSQPTEHYPFPVMLDPVTEVTPHVKVK